MKLQRLLSLVRKAVDDYQMISAGDRIAIGISGGKDSLALLFALHELQRFYPFPFELCAFTVDLGFGIQDFKAIQALCDDFSIPYTVISTARCSSRPAKSLIHALSAQKCGKVP